MAVVRLVHLPDIAINRFRIQHIAKGQILLLSSVPFVVSCVSTGSSAGAEQADNSITAHSRAERSFIKFTYFIILLLSVRSAVYLLENKDNGLAVKHCFCYYHLLHGKGQAIHFNHGKL